MPSPILSGRAIRDANPELTSSNFTAVVNAFDQACGTSATYQHWNATNSLTAAHLEDTNDSALGSGAFKDVNISSLLAVGQLANQNLTTAQLTQSQVQR